MANTPNIDLVKPAGTDHALVSVLNSNSDKIDTFAGTTNQAISNLNLSWGPVDGTTEKAWITNANLNDYTTSGIYLIGATPTNAPTSWGILIVYAGRQDTLSQIFERDGLLFLREKRSDSWSSWAELAPKSYIDNILNGTKFRAYANLQEISIDLGVAPSTTHFGVLTLINANQDVMYNIAIADSIVCRKVGAGVITLTASVSGTVLTITASSKLWGATLVYYHFD